MSPLNSEYSPNTIRCSVVHVTRSSNPGDGEILNLENNNICAEYSTFHHEQNAKDLSSKTSLELDDKGLEKVEQPTKLNTTTEKRTRRSKFKATLLKITGRRSSS